jgi:hypothetical protein
MSSDLSVRVTVLDTWDEIPMHLPPETAIAELKARALTASRVTRSPAEYQVKYLGAELMDEGATLAESGVVANAALIVLSRRRRPSI